MNLIVVINSSDTSACLIHIWVKHEVIENRGGSAFGGPNQHDIRQTNVVSHVPLFATIIYGWFHDSFGDNKEISNSLRREMRNVIKEEFR
jgi:hypothetical protein